MAKEKAPPIEQRPNVVRLWQDDAVIQHLENTFTELIHGEEDIPDSLGEKLAVMIADKQQTIDRVAAWLVQLEGQIEVTKRMEEGWRTIRKRSETAHKSFCRTLQQYIDDPANAGKVTDGNKLVGAVLKIYTQQNGVAALKITDDSTIPDDYRYWEFRVRAYAGHGDNVQASLAAIADAFNSGGDGPVVVTVVRTQRSETDPETPNLFQHEYFDTAKIRAALDAGLKVPGAELNTGRHLRHTNMGKKHLIELEALDEPAQIEAEPAVIRAGEGFIPTVFEEEDNG